MGKNSHFQMGYNKERSTNPYKGTKKRERKLQEKLLVDTHTRKKKTDKNIVKSK